MVSGLNYCVIYTKCIKLTYNRSFLFISCSAGSTCSLCGKCNIGSCEFSIIPAIHKNQFRIYYLYEECQKHKTLVGNTKCENSSLLGCPLAVLCHTSNFATHKNSIKVFVSWKHTSVRLTFNGIHEETDFYL